MTPLDSLNEDEVPVCSGCETVGSRDQLEGWRVIELGLECPVCRDKSELIEAQRAEDGVANMGIDGIVAVVKALPRSMLKKSKHIFVAGSFIKR